MSLGEIFKKQGGFELLKRYYRGGALFTAIMEFIILGKSRTSLEILRLSTGLKIKQKLEKKYKKLLNQFECEWEVKEHIQSDKVWICWFQGIENAPDLVQRCFESIKENLNNKDVILITEKNMRDYVQFPSYIQDKIDKGIIKGAHLSDLLRLELLIKYGGTWIDSTVFCSGENVPNYMLNSELFMFQCMKPGRDGHSTVISNWYISAWTNNKLLSAVQYLLYKYWEKNDDLVDYFIFHIFFQMVIEKYPDEWNKVIPFSNATPHILLLRLFEEYNEDVWKAIKSQTVFHKLSYKNKETDLAKENTYYKKVLEN